LENIKKGKEIGQMKTDNIFKMLDMANKHNGNGRSRKAEVAA
jgi:hypothetical protein